MSVSYDIFKSAFLQKITEYDLLDLAPETRDDLLNSYLKRAMQEFNKVSEYDFMSHIDDENDAFDIDIPLADIDEIVNIVSEGMVVQWLKPFLYRQELLENALNTRDFTTYSPAELLKRVGDAHKQAQKDFTQMSREYSYNHGDLSRLHL